MTEAHWRWLTLGTILAMVYLPHWFGISFPMPASGQWVLAGHQYATTYVNYASFFEPFADWAASVVRQYHHLPLWNAGALFGLPMIEQSEHSILNPLEWLNWFGNWHWRVLLISLELAWGAWGVFILVARGMTYRPHAAYASAIVYALAGAAPHALGDFCCLVHVMCLPHLVYQATRLASDPRGVVATFFKLTVYAVLLLLTGQPQFLLVGGLFAAILLGLYGWQCGSWPCFYLIAAAAASALLVAAPALMPFITANLSGMAFPSNHQLSGSASYWKINYLTFARIFSGRLTGYVDPTWFRTPTDTSELIIDHESFSISFGPVAASFATLGGVWGLRSILQRERSPMAALRASVSATLLLMIGLLLIHNFSGPNSYPWFFRFVNFNKYAPPMLALLVCLALPAGMEAFTEGGRGRRLITAGIALLFPALCLLMMKEHHALITDGPLFLDCVLITFLPLVALMVSALQRTRPPTSLLRLTAGFVLFEVILLSNWGLALPFDWFRIALITGATLSLLAGWQRSLVGKLVLLAAVLISALWVRLHSRWLPLDFSVDRQLADFSAEYQRAHGYQPRLLTAAGLTFYPWDAAHGLRVISSRCPVIPEATQALLSDYPDPASLERRRQRFPFIEFHGVIGPGEVGYLSWSDLAATPSLLDLLGVDAVVDLRTGWVRSHGAELGNAFGAGRSVGESVYVREREPPLGRIYFAPGFHSEPFVPDGWAVRRRLRESTANGDQRPVIELDPATVPSWYGFVLHNRFEPTLPAAGSMQVVRTIADRDGLFEADVIATGRGLLIFREQFWPGWKASVNGAPVPDLRVNSVFQGLIFPGAGPARIRFEFVGTLTRDLALSGVGVILTLALLPALIAIARCSSSDQRETGQAARPIASIHE